MPNEAFSDSAAPETARTPPLSLLITTLLGSFGNSGQQIVLQDCIWLADRESTDYQYLRCKKFIFFWIKEAESQVKCAVLAGLNSTSHAEQQHVSNLSLNLLNWKNGAFWPFSCLRRVATMNCNWAPRRGFAGSQLVAPEPTRLISEGCMLQDRKKKEKVKCKNLCPQKHCCPSG